MDIKETTDSKSSSEDKSTIKQNQRSRVGNRIPVASANGNEMAKLNDNVGSRRKRVRISTSTTQSEPNIRSLNRFETTQDDPYPRQSRSYSNNNAERAVVRKNYEEEYQRNRSQRNYSSKSYNKPEAETNRTNKNNRYKNNGKTNKYSRKNKSEHIELPKPIKFKEELPEDMEIRINKYIANSGICSRREADLMIEKGEVMVNGVVVTELGTRVKPIDEVICRGEKISVESKVYLLLNKPKNCVTTLDDPEGRTTVMDIVKNACKERIYPVGRLDRNTMGVLLLTNDGELASKLTHPSYMKKKIYHVWLNKPVSPEHMQNIVDGIELEDGEIHADALSYVKENDQRQVGIEIHSGRNRIVRRIFEHLGYRVVKLDRVYFSGLTKKNLPRGRWRFLEEQEVINLRNGSFE